MNSQQNQTDRIARQHAQGKLTARERIELLLDPHSFEEVDQHARSIFTKDGSYTDGVVTGFGKIHTRIVALYAQDFTINGGSLGKRHAEKIGKVMDMAAKIGCPIIGIIDSGGARIQEGIHALAGYGDIFMRNVRTSGVVPQISIILGPCAGGAVYSPALTDFIFTVESISHLFVTGPSVIQQVLHETITKNDLGGTHVHATKSGVVHHVAQTEKECFEAVKKCLSYLPDNYRSMPSRQKSIQPKKIDWEAIVPRNTLQAYDVRRVIDAIVDNDSFFEIQESFAPNIVTGFARIQGQTIGIVANQALVKAGTLDIDASAKAARFINTCNNFNIPIISLVDVPGFLPGVDQEHDGIIRHGAKLLYAYAHATVPKITIILRKAFGGAYIVMGSKHLGADFNFALAQAQIAVMGAKGAVAILHRKELTSINDSAQYQAKQQLFESHYTNEYLHPHIAAEAGYVDAIIEPHTMRTHIIRSLEITYNKVDRALPKTQGNTPL